MKGRILGPQGQNVKHITTMTGAKVQLKGRGASLSPDADGPEDMHLDLNASSEISLNKAVELANNLVETVRQEYVASVTKPLHIATTDTYATQPFGAIPPSYLQQYQPIHQGPNNTSGKFSIGSSNVPTFPPPPPMFSIPVRNTEIASRLQLPAEPQGYKKVQSQTNQSSEPAGIVGNAMRSKAGCVPFLYPDSDGVVKVTADVNISESTTACALSGVVKHVECKRVNTIMLNGGIHHQNHGAATAAHSSYGVSSSLMTNNSNNEDRKHANGSSSHGNSCSSSSNDSRNRDRNDSTESAPGRNKRRRGFQESTVYTAPTDCPLPISTIHADPLPLSLPLPTHMSSTSSPSGAVTHSRELSSYENGRMIAESSRVVAESSRAAVDSGRESMSGNKFGRSRTSFEVPARSDGNMQCAPAVEPPADVMIALAAMTERRLMSKISRPTVPSFSSGPIGIIAVAGSTVKPTVPLFFSSPDKPLVPSFASSEKTEATLHTVVACDVLQSSSKLPGLVDYEDDDDDE